MKQLWKIVISCFLLLTMTVPAFGGITNAENWAVSTVEMAYEEGLVPQPLLNKATTPITRKEFCTMAVLFYEKVTGKKAEPSKESPFVDCKVEEVVFAYEAGIVSGVSPTKFNPEGYLTREQMAIMVTRVMKACDLPMPTGDGKTSFSDIAALPAGSQDAIKALAKAEISSGERGKFYPKNNLTVQEAVVLFYRTYGKVMGKEIPSAFVATKEATVTVGGKTVSLGQSKTELETAWGIPSRVEKDAYGRERSVYLNDYQAMVLITWKEDSVAEIFTNGKDFSYGQVKALADVGGISNVRYWDKANGIANLNTQGYDAKVLLSHESRVDGILLQETDGTTGLKKQYNAAFTKQTQQTVFDLMNAARVAKGLTPLQWNDETAKIAENHSMDMYQGDYVGYTDRKGKMVFQRMQEKGFVFDMAAELVGKVDGDAIMIYHGWMQKIGSRSNILNPHLVNCGVGIYNHNYSFFVTADFYTDKK